MTVAQSAESAKHDAIVRSAIATGMVDLVLPPEEMPAKPVQYAAQLRDLHDRPTRGALFPEPGRQLAQIFSGAGTHGESILIRYSVFERLVRPAVAPLSRAT